MGCPAGLPGRTPGPVDSPSLHSTPWRALTLGLPSPGGQCSPALTLPRTQALPRHFLRFPLWATPGDPCSPRPCWVPVPGGLFPQAPTATPCVPQVPELTGAQGPGGPQPGTAEPAQTSGVRVEGHCSRFASPRLPHVLRAHQHPWRGQGGHGHRVGLGPPHWTVGWYLGQPQGGCSQATPQQEGGGFQARGWEPHGTGTSSGPLASDI